MDKITILIGLFLVSGILLCGCTTTPGPESESAQVTVEPSSQVSAQEENPEPTVKETTPMETESANAEDSKETLSFAEEMDILQKRINAQPPLEIPLGTTQDIYLKENPTTGYSWNATVTEGLIIVNDSYSPNPKPENGERLVGSGGMHHWTIEGVTAGNQTFSAVYSRSWEAASPEDITYTEIFSVIE